MIRTSTVLVRRGGLDIGSAGLAAIARTATTGTRSFSAIHSTTATTFSTVQEQPQEQPTLFQHKFRSAARELQQHGINALKPSLVVASVTTTDSTTATETTASALSSNMSSIELLQQKIRNDNYKDRKRWNKPLVSNRIANVLRKQAIVSNTYGTFDVNTGIGWDKQWDIALQYAKTSVADSENQSNVGRIRVLKPKLSKHYRTREDRAKQIEQKLVGMDERIEELYAARLKKKPHITFEYTYNKMVKGATRK
jgi:hypothetical protein